MLVLFMQSDFRYGPNKFRSPRIHIIIVVNRRCRTIFFRAPIHNIICIMGSQLDDSIFLLFSNTFFPFQIFHLHICLISRHSYSDFQLFSLLLTWYFSLVWIWMSARHRCKHTSLMNLLREALQLTITIIIYSTLQTTK